MKPSKRPETDLGESPMRDVAVRIFGSFSRFPIPVSARSTSSKSIAPRTDRHGAVDNPSASIVSDESVKSKNPLSSVASA